MLRTLMPALAGLLFAAPCGAAELLLPQERSAFYVNEPIDLSVVGLKKGETTVIELVPAAKGLGSFSFKVTGDGSTVHLTLPHSYLAPSDYALRLGDKPAGKLTITSGVPLSPLYLSATVSDPKGAGVNFLVSNAFGFGLFDQKGQPSKDVRRRSTGMQVFDNAVRDGLPSLVYMYWTGYVTHKPFGSEKSWAAKDLAEATRLLSFHTAQRLSRYDQNILLVGTLDEPGLSWGKTPAGGMASGFPNWDEEGWYATRGWKYTQDPASRDDADWMKYMTVRCGIMREVNAQAKKDLNAVWRPTTGRAIRFSTDLYAPQAVMDGTDPLNQQVNDIPSSHVFLDWGCGKLGALSGLYLEKADDPRRKIAHAMNGQLFARTVPQPHQRNAYRLMLNAMLAAGLSSNWWLNPTGMTNEDLAWVNEPAIRLGGLFDKYAPADHDVAVLWSFTEACMRQKDVTAKEAKKKTGEQIKLMIASLPDIPGAKDKQVEINAYNVGGNYKEQVLNAHQALARAGYPAHIIHERVLKDHLKRYKTLVVVGQTFELPADVRKAVDDWIAGGGVVVVDGTSKVKFKGAVETKADLKDPAFRWGAYFGKAEQSKHPFKNDREASYYLTNYFMDEMARKATPHFKDAMKKTQSQPAIETDSVHLAAEKHTAGKASLYMVLNAHDRLPDLPEKERHRLYNYAPLEATFTLRGIKPGSTVYCFSGQDWKKVSEVKDYDKPQKAKFEPGEMKLYLVSPSSLKPSGFAARGDVSRSFDVNLPETFAPYPVTLRVVDPKGKEVYRLYRATRRSLANRSFDEAEREITLPLAANAPEGKYRCELSSPLWDKPLEATFKHEPDKPGLAEKHLLPVPEGQLIAHLMSRWGEAVVAYGEKQKLLAETLTAGLKKRGIKAVARPESDVLRKVAYPRVWNPFAQVYSAKGDEKKPGEVKVEITLSVDKEGKLTATTKGGKDVSQDWKQPSSLVTIAGEGYVDFSGDRELCYEPGVKLYLDKDRRVTVLKGTPKEEKTTEAFRKKWAKPWDRLTTHVGAYQLPAQLPEAYTTDSHLILLGDSTTSNAVAALQASELLSRVVDAKYPGPGKALIQYAWSPFAVEKDVIFVGASDKKGLEAGVQELLSLMPRD